MPSCCPGLEVPLHQAVFETVITDDGDRAVLSQQPRRRRKQLLQVVQLAVDGNPQGLKRPGRRMSRLDAFRRASARHAPTTAANCPVVVIGSRCRACTMYRAIRRDARSCPYSKIKSASDSSSNSLIISAAVTSKLASILMSNGISVRKLSPISLSVIWPEQRPKSARRKSTSLMPNSARRSAIWEKLDWRRMTLHARPANRCRARSRDLLSTSKPTSVPAGPSRCRTESCDLRVQWSHRPSPHPADSLSVRLKVRPRTGTCSTFASFTAASPRIGHLPRGGR